MESKLLQLEKRKQQWSLALVIALGALLVGCFIAGYIWKSLIISLGFTYTATLAMKEVDRIVCRYWITSYYIQEEPGIIKVFGGIPLRDWSFVEARVLALRPDYRIEHNAFDRFKCTMAAVPASAEYLKARQEFDAIMAHAGENHEPQ